MEGMEAKEMIDGGAGEPVLRKMPHALKYEVVARWKRARVGRLTLPHHVCDTPMFMPVGTQAPPSPFLFFYNSIILLNFYFYCFIVLFLIFSTFFLTAGHGEGADDGAARGARLPRHPRQHLPPWPQVPFSCACRVVCVVLSLTGLVWCCMRWCVCVRTDPAARWCSRWAGCTTS